MKLRITHPLTQVVLTSIVTIAISVGCSASRSAGSPAQGTDNPTISQSSSPTVSSSGQEKATCTLDMSQAPTIKGLKLGMTPEELLALFPGSKEDADLQSRISSPPSPFGNTSFVIHPRKYQSKAEFTDVSQVTISLLDGRVSSFTMGFNSPEWKHVDEFVAKFIEDTNLPGADQWQAYSGLDTQMKTLTCADFSIRLFAGGTGGNLNYVLLQDLEADKQLKERRRKMREQASPTPGQ